MTAIVVRRSSSAEAEAFSATERKMFIATQDRAHHLVVPYAPRDIEYGARARATAEIERPGRPPILSPGAEPTPTMTYDLFFGATDPEDEDAAWQLEALEAIAQSEQRVVVTFSSAEAGLWRITDLSYSSMARHPETQEITRATATVTFTLAVDYVTQVGPVTGGYQATPPAGGTATTYVGGGTYVVRKGDSLGDVARRFYGDPKLWRYIATANKIRNPQQSSQFPSYGKMKPGSKLKIPRIARPRK